MILNRVSRALFAVLFGMFFTFPCVSLGQATGGMTQKDVSYNNHVYTFKILGSGMGQILKDGQVAGTILPDGSGGEKVMGVSSVTPPSDVLVAYGMYKGGASASSTGGAAGSPAAGAGAKPVLGTEGVTPSFDAATNTASFSDGTVVTFVDKDHAKLRWPAGYGVYQDFDLVYHGGSTGGFMRGVARSDQGVVGQSLGGSGVKFMMQATANTRTAEVFDTGEGTTIYTAKVAKFKPMIHAVLQAADAANAAGHSVDDLRVVKSIRSNNLGIK
jgi:hypothetical protein